MRTIVFLFIVSSFISCENKKIDDLNCEELINGMVENNETLVRLEMEKIMGDLHPNPQPEDMTGHSVNLDLVVQRINSACPMVVASLLCYACIDTYPPMSEIRIEFEREGNLMTKTIDILTPNNDVLRYGGMHD